MGRPPDGVIRCLIYVRISMDKAHDGHGVANQMAKLEQKARERGWTVVYRLSDNDIGVTRKDPTKPGKYRPGYEEAMRLVDARAVDAVLCFKWDRFIREPLDLEYLIPRFDKAGVRFAEVDGNIDLGTDSGRLARADPDRGGQGRAGAQGRAAEAGQRAGGDQRQAVHWAARARSGICEDHVTAHPVEGPAVAEACAALLGGGTISGIMREWTKLELAPPQRDRRGTTRWNRTSIRSILLNPRIAGLSVYHGEIVGQGQWEPLVREETWRAVRGILEDPARKPPRGVRTLLGGLACCPCGNVVTGMPSHTGHRVYRCSAPTRGRSWPGAHVARQAAPVETFIEKLVMGRLSRADAADLVRDPQERGGCGGAAGGGGGDPPEPGRDGRRPGTGTDHPAADCSPRPSGRTFGWMRSAPSWSTRRGRTCWPRWWPPRTRPSCGRRWTISRKRAVIKTLMTVTLHSPGRGARLPFDPATVMVNWRQGKSVSATGSFASECLG